MISFIRGPLIEIEEDTIVVEAQGVGYNIRVPVSVVDGLPGIGKEVRIYTYLQVREDAMSLFGFLTRQDLKMFKQLLGVNGIGPKGALGLLSVLRPDDLHLPNRLGCLHTGISESNQRIHRLFSRYLTICMNACIRPP